MKRPHIGPILFNDALDTMKIAFENPSTDTQAIFQRGFKSFIKALAYEVDQEREWTRPTTRSVTLSLIVSHSIWTPALEIIVALPPGEHATAAQKSMKTLERIRQKIPLQSLTPPMEPSTPPDEAVDSDPSSERDDGVFATSPHISIDIEPKHDDDHGTTAIPGTSSHPAGDTGPEEDKDTGGADDQITLDEQPATTIPSPFAPPTPPIDSPASLPGPPLL